jgi:HlyD family secretion protein
MRVFGKRGRIIAVVAVLVVVVATTGVLLSRAFAGGVTIPTATAKTETLSVTVSVSGKTEADRKRDVFPPAAGTLSKVNVTEGQEVAAGEVLATLGADQLDAAVDAADTAYDQAVSQLETLDSASPSSAERAAVAAQITATKRAYDRAKSAYDAASVAAARARAEAKEAAEAARETARSAKEQAYAAYLAAKAQQARLSASGDTSARRDAARSGRDNASRALARAKANRRKAEMRAPISGVVIFNAIGAPGADGAAPKATDGAGVSPAAAPFTVVDLSSLRFAGQLDESDVPRVKNGSAAVVELDAVPGKQYKTSVLAVRPNATTTTNGATVFPVTMRVDNADGALRIGMSGTVVISVADVANAVSIPIEALVDGKDGASVFLVQNGTLVQRKVTTGVMTETSVQIAKGLKTGETVAIAAGGTLRAGMQVRTGGKR